MIVGRGAVNQKGPEAPFLAALHAIQAAGKKLPVNLVLVVRRRGGDRLAALPRRSCSKPDVLAALKKVRRRLHARGGAGRSTATSTVNLGAKGVIELELVSSGEKWGRGPAKDIHSSLKAQVDSPVWRLVQALDTLVDAGRQYAGDRRLVRARSAPLTPARRS